MIGFSLISFVLFPDKDGHRDPSDWLLLIMFPILVSAMLATLTSLFLAAPEIRSASVPARATALGQGAHARESLKDEGAQSVPDEVRAPFADWLAREWSISGCGSLSVALSTYIRTFDLSRPARAGEPGEIADYRLKLAILKGSLVGHPKWTNALELKEYIQDLESLIEVFASVPPVGDAKQERQPN